MRQIGHKPGHAKFESEEKQLTLYELVSDVTIQGNVRISYWENDEEQVIRTFDGVEYILNHQIPKRYRDADVIYMFCPGDGYLHIEVESEDQR